MGVNILGTKEPVVRVPSPQPEPTEEMLTEEDLAKKLKDGVLT